VNGTADDGLPRGTIALDPARLADVYFGGESFSRSYVSNPYTGSTSGRDAVAFFVRGFGGVHSPPAVEQYLRNRGADTRVVNWNDIGGLGFPGAITAEPEDFIAAVLAMPVPPVILLDIPFIDVPDPDSDDGFVSDMVTLLNTYDDSDTIILVGASFGGDSILKVAQATSRHVDLLAVLDPVGPVGLRETLAEPVPTNVRYFYNRWQETTPFPIDFLTSGCLENNARGSVDADFSIPIQSEISPSPATGLAHNDVPSDLLT
jgi:pimeloyl-ACP methyl ester carboxylesterase